MHIVKSVLKLICKYNLQRICAWFDA